MTAFSAPTRFGSLADARAFCERFFTANNHEHRHSGIGMHAPVPLRPAVRHGHAGLAPVGAGPRPRPLAPSLIARSPLLPLLPQRRDPAEHHLMHLVVLDGDRDQGRDVLLAPNSGSYRGGHTDGVVGHRVCRVQDQAISPVRSIKRPEPAPGFSVARLTMASVPSVTVWGPLWPLRSVAV